MGIFNKSVNKANIPVRRHGNDRETIENELPRELKRKMEIIRPYTKKNMDIIIRSITLNSDERINAAVVFLDGCIDTDHLNRDILKPLMNNIGNVNFKKRNSKTLVDFILDSCLTVGQVEKVENESDFIQSLFDGLLLLLIDGVVEAFVISIQGVENRALSEPVLDRTICGPRKGFIENLSINIAILRRMLKDPKFIVEKIVLGKRTRTDVAIMYIEDIADSRIVEEVKTRLKMIEIDGILSVGYLCEFLQDSPRSIFPQSRDIERPDIVVAELLEGRVVIMADESPLAVSYPAGFVQMLQAAEDYYGKASLGSFFRAFRYLAFFIAVSLPALYIGLISFQQELIPYELIIPLAEARRQVPFPVTVELVIQEIIIQLIFEAGLRLPSLLAQTVGVVGGIILGQAAISAKLASPAIIIIIVVTTLSTFTIPNVVMSMSVRIVRLFMIILSSAFGMFGFSLGWLVIIAHLISLESMDVPYLSPLAPLRNNDLKDSFFRSPIWKMKRRPDSVPGKNKIKQKQ